jgi:16S rRNA (uracil1498-N3)-methyltransferase
MKHSFYIPSENISENKVIFTPEQNLKIRKVLRLKDKDFIRVSNGCGLSYKVNALTGDIFEKTFTEKNCPVSVNLILGISKSNAFETSLQKAVELGVDNIIPFVAERSLIKIKDAEKKKSRYLDIMISAFCQCKRNYMPVLSGIADNIAEIDIKNGLKLLLYEEEKENTLKNALEKNNNPREITLYIGPEGGITSNEAGLFLEKGFIPCKLNDNILRCETAVIAALSGLYFYYGT